MTSIVYQKTLDLDGVDISGLSLRLFLPVTGGCTGKVRATLSSGSLGTTIAHVAIAVLGSATKPSVQVTPTELTYSGGSGFTLGANTSITSDFVTFPFLVTDTVCVIVDVTTGNVKATISNLTTEDGWHSTGSTYNTTAMAGGVDDGLLSYVSLIETDDILMPQIWM